MAEVKTKPTDASVDAFLNGAENERKRRDSFALMQLMQEVTGEEPTLWGSIVGFGHYHYRYDSGREGDTFLTGFSPRKQNFALYNLGGFEETDALLSQLGKHKMGSTSTSSTMLIWRRWRSWCGARWRT